MTQLHHDDKQALEGIIKRAIGNKPKLEKELITSISGFVEVLLGKYEDRINELNEYANKLKARVVSDDDYRMIQQHHNPNYGRPYDR